MRITKSLICFVRDVFNTERTKFLIVLHTITTRAPTVMEAVLEKPPLGRFVSHETDLCRLVEGIFRKRGISFRVN